jgi:MSHA biogenesis protein MshL
MVYRLHGLKRIKHYIVLLSGLMLSACAHENALLQSPQANSTESIDEINAVLDELLVQQTIPTLETIPEDVMSALTPGNILMPSQKYQSEPRLDIAVKDVPARDFFAELVAGTRFNMLVDPAVEGTISLNLKDVTMEEVLEITHRLYGYEYEKEGRLIHVTAPGLRTQIFAINYLNVARDGDSETRVSSGQITQSNSGGDDNGAASTTRTVGSGTRITTKNEHRFWETLSQTLELIIGDKEGHSVIITPTTGIAVVRADASSLADVKRYLERADLILKRQVILEAKILEVSLSKGYQQGIDWSFSDASSALDANGDPKRGIGLKQTAQAIAADAGGVFASAIKFNNFDATINLLGTQGNVQVLSSPRIATVNNQKAVIKVGSDEFYVTDIDFQSNDDTNSDSTDIELTPFFSGIALDVTPQISEDGKIILHVHPTISKVEDQTKTISINGQDTNLPLALSSIRESDSIITAENGQIVVIGGLIQNRNADSNGSVPFFGDIPLLGELFKQKKESSEKTELVILLRPTLTDQQTIQSDIRASRERFGRFRDRMAAPTETSFYE